MKAERTMKIAIFASGSGSNAENIVRFFNNDKKIEISLILTNNKNAFVLERAKLLNIPSKIFTKKELSTSLPAFLKNQKIDFIVLAGFLLLIPSNLIELFPNRIINIHPALLPKYGGKGMYGNKVHQAVKNNLEKETGITIHFVNEKYDEGAIIFQEKCAILPNDSVEDIAQKVHALEYKLFPIVIKKVLS